ncbi:hypothetical protein HDU67_000816 [Dinochytrium kinnereticum]|nr:hypothetical protein HDU67_000816 [Dinochytrium kinnereticum]
MAPAPPPPPPPADFPSQAPPLQKPPMSTTSPSVTTSDRSQPVTSSSTSTPSQPLTTCSASASSSGPTRPPPPRPLTVVTPASPSASNGSLASTLPSNQLGSISSLSSPVGSEFADGTTKRAAGKAGRKRRPESMVAAAQSPSVTDQAWASPAAVAAVSMSRIRGGGAIDAGGGGGSSDRESSLPRKPKHRGSYIGGGGSGDELDDMGSTHFDSDGSAGGGGGGVAVATMRAERRGTTNRKRISMVNEMGEEDPSMPPAPGVASNVLGAPVGQRHHGSMEHLVAQSAVTKNRSKFESSMSGSALALNSSPEKGLNPLQKKGPASPMDDDDESSPSSPMARSQLSLSPSAVSNGPTSPGPKIAPSMSMSSVATASRASKSASDFFGFGASKRKPSATMASGDDPSSPSSKAPTGLSSNNGGASTTAPSPTSAVQPLFGSGSGDKGSGSGAAGNGSGGLASAMNGSISQLSSSAHPALNISGGVGMRKGRKASTMSLATVNIEPEKSARKGSKIKDSSADIFKMSSDSADDTEFPPTIDLGILFGTKNNPEVAYERMIAAARCYEASRPLWVKQQQASSDNAPAYTNPGEEIKYRILENFRDGKLDSLTYEKKNNATEFIASGSPEALIDALIFPLNQDNSYAEVFMATYRFFIPATDVLTSLIEWYNVEVDEDATPQQEAYLKRNRKYFRSRSIRSLLIWIKNHWHDFHSDRELLDELMAFVAEVSEVSFGDSQKMTQAIREQRLSWYMTQYIPLFSNKRAAATESAKPWGLLWEAEAFAEQLTLIDFDFFRQIRPDAYLHLMHLPAKRESGGQNVALKVSSYTATLILREDSSKKKAKALKKFIKIARVCRDLNNFNTTFAIIYGLRRPAVAKQTSAWEQVPTKYLEIVKDLEHLMDPADGYSNFWAELKSTHPPAIPFFAAYIHDLLEIHHDIPIHLPTTSQTSLDLTPDSRMADINGDTDARMIHFAKFYDLYAVVAELEVWRTSSYANHVQAPERETTAIVLNHLRDYPVMEDRAIWSDGSPGGLAAAVFGGTPRTGSASSPGGEAGGSVGVGVGGRGLKKAGSFVAG